VKVNVAATTVDPEGILVLAGVDVAVLVAPDDVYNTKLFGELGGGISDALPVTETVNGD
jgi:hypothetical protein